MSFLDGDPDQPRQVYHLENPPPYELPRHKTRSTIKTASSPAGSPSQARGHNELRFEDRAGAEEVYLRAQLDRNDLVQHDYSRTVGHDEHAKVKNAYTEEVGCSYRQEIGRGVEDTR